MLCWRPVRAASRGQVSERAVNEALDGDGEEDVAKAAVLPLKAWRADGDDVADDRREHLGVAPGDRPFHAVLAHPWCAGRPDEW